MMPRPSLQEIGEHILRKCIEQGMKTLEDEEPNFYAALNFVLLRGLFWGIIITAALEVVFSFFLAL
jgi:hypothetical protein